MKHKIAEMLVKTVACDSAVYRTGKNIDDKTAEFIQNGLSASEAKLQALREYAIECAILKVKASDSTDYVVDETLQIHGGMGYAVETGIEMGYRDARITRIYEGTNEINRLLSVAELGKRAVISKELDLKTAGKVIPGQLFEQILPFSKANEAKIVEHLKSLFLLLLDVTGRKYKAALEHEQEIVMNLSDILSEAYLAESLFLRIEKLKSTQQADAKKITALEAALKIYLYNALTIARNASKEIIDAYAEGFEHKKMTYLANLLTKPYNINAKNERRKVADYAIACNTYPF